MSKQRLTISLDQHLVEAAKVAVEQGRTESLSAFVGEAVARLVEAEIRAAQMDRLIADYESTNGVITDLEMAEQAQMDRDSAASVRINRRLAG